MQEMQAEYSLPALHEWVDGYCQGDASNQDIIELVQNINIIENLDEPMVYCVENDDDVSNLLTDVYEYLDKKLIKKLEESIESQIKEFGDNEYSKNQFDNYKDKAESVIKKLLDNEYYKSGGQIGHDYSVYFLADEMRIVEHIEASSNRMFQKYNEARFNIVHLNNYDNAFKDYTDLISEYTYDIVRDNMKIDMYTYYHCEYFAKMSNRMSQIIVAVYQD